VVKDSTGIHNVSDAVDAAATLRKRRQLLQVTLAHSQKQRILAWEVLWRRFRPLPLSVVAPHRDDTDAPW